MSTAIPFTQQTHAEPRRKVAAFAFSLRWWLLTIALLAVAFRAGYLIGFEAGFSAGPIRLQPGDLPDNWTPPVKGLEKVKDR